MLCVSLCFALLNICMKKLHSHFDPVMISAIRSFCCIMIFLPVAYLFMKARKSLKAGMTRLNFYKGVIDFMSIPAWALAVSNMNIAEAVALTQTYPLFVTIFAVIFLRERITLRKLLIISIGFIGAIIITKPHTENFNAYSFVVIFVCVLWASSNIMTKFLTNRTQNPLAIIVYTNLIIFLLSLPNTIFYFTFPPDHLIPIALLMSFLAGTGYLFVAHACSVTEVSILAQVDSFRFIFAAIVAYIFLGQTVDKYTIIGASIIISATSYLAISYVKEAKISKTGLKESNLGKATL
jgi:drug/metabolite transporter (DMT)-like permease